ncbi:MAG: eCIS core domain-containing protein, partial [Fluviicola sp.]
MKETIHKTDKSPGSPFRSRGTIQPKLFANKPGDRHEVEADTAADTVVKGSAANGPTSAAGPAPAPAVQLKPIAQTVTPYIQRKEAPGQMGQLDVEGTEDKMGTIGHEGMIQRKEEDDEPVQRMEEGGSEPETEEAETDTESDGAEEADEADTPDEGGDEGVQMKEEDDASAQLKEEDDAPVQTKRFDQAPPAPSENIGSQLQSTKGQGSALPSDVKTEMESGFGADFSNVRVHTGTKAEEMNQSLRAKAFTNKGDIYFNQGKYDPASKDGKFLLAHELTHTIQQGAAAPKTDVQAPGKQAGTENAPKDTKEAKALTETQAPALKVAAPAQTGGAVPAAAKDAKVEIPKAGKKDENGKETTEEAPKEEAAPEKKKPDPKADPNFMEVTQNIAVTADQQAEHQPAGVLSEDSQEAAESPGNERESIAQAEQVEEMKEAEPKPFNAASFKAKLMARIDSMQLPENQDEADNFDENNNIDEVNKEAVGDVNAEKDASVGPVAETSQAAPQTGKVPKRKTVPLKPLQKGKKPGSVGASKAVPPKRGDEEISQPLKEQTAEVDNKMAENNVTDEQLEKSQEPKFTQALDSKKEAKTKAEEAPKNFRKKEEETLQGTAAKSDAASQEQLAGMHAMRGGAFQKVMGNQKGTGKKDTSERERIAGEINTIYEDTKKDVEGILDTLEDRVSSMFEITAEKAKKTFEDYVEGCMAWYKIERYSGPLGLIKWTKDLFVGLPDEVNKFFVKGKEKFTEVMEQGINVIAKHVAGQLNMAQTRIKRGQKDVEKYVEGLPKNLRHLGKEAASEIQDKFSALQDDVNSREEALIDTLAQEYVAAMEEVDERIEEMKAENRGLIDSVMGFINGVIDTINKLVEMITNLFAAIKSVIGVIIQDPIGFMGNLFDGIGKGIDAFKANIQTHLLSGLLEWLTGSLGPIGIVMPKDIFSLSGIFNLVLQVLGLGWDYIRLKAVKMMGEPVVKALEGGYDMFKTFATKGVDGIWEFLKDKFSDLKEVVIDAI